MDAAAIERRIDAGATAMQQTLPAGAAAKLARLLLELVRWNTRINLTAIRNTDEMIGGHVLDSLSVRGLLAGRRIVDVGTGAGFPGLPLALAEPDRDITLIDSNGKKISFVRHMIGELGLTNATAVQVRVERYSAAPRFDTVIARAFAPLPRMIALVGHLLDDTGVLLAQKGKYPAPELAELTACGGEWDCNVTELTVPGLTGKARHAVTLRRKAGTGT